MISLCPGKEFFAYKSIACIGAAGRAVIVSSTFPGGSGPHSIAPILTTVLQSFRMHFTCTAGKRLSLSGESPPKK
jgi:hypothetical protein